MQDDFETNFPTLDIRIIGINRHHTAAGNAEITAGRDLPWLQDVDLDNSNEADVWESWAVTYRDVFIVDENNEQVGVYNLTTNDLGVPANYDTLRQMFVDAATTPPEISVADVSINEGDLGTSTLTFNVTLSSASSQTVTVDFTTVDGTALAGNDYAANSGTLTFNPGTTNATVSITILDDRAFEADETFQLMLSGPTNATIADGDATATLLNNDAVPTVSIDNQTVVEGDSGTSDVVFNVSLSNPSSLPITVDVATTDGTATVAGGDYLAHGQTLTFAPGETTKPVSVTVNGDTDDEPDETFDVQLSNPTNATLDVALAAGTIADDDLAGALSVTGGTVNEGDTGTTVIDFTVTLSGAGIQPVTVDYATATGTAGSEDFQAVNGSLTFAPGETSKTVTVQVNADLLDEVDETFTLELSNPGNATIAVGQATGTITDDDDPPAVSVADTAITEGDSGQTEVPVVFSLSSASGRAVTIDYQSADNTALAPGDYVSGSGSLTFEPGETEKTVIFRVVGDSANEGDEDFLVSITAATSATIDDNEATITIIDDDPPGVIAFGRAAYTVDEDAGTAIITVTRTGGDAGGVTVDYATGNITAVAGPDYTPAAGTLTFAAGETTKTFAVPITLDNAEESAETISLTLTNPGGGATLGGTANASLIINDTPRDPMQRLVADYYRGFLKRDGEAAGMEFYHQRLADGRMTRESMARAFQNSPEYREKFIAGLYDDLLNRDAAGGIDVHMRGLDAGNSPEMLRAVFLGSDEYYQRHDGNRDGFLAGLFQDVLGRGIGPVGRATFHEALADGRSREEVAMAVIKSAESRRQTVIQMYDEFLSRTASEDEIGFHANALRAGLSETGLAAHFAASDEYFARL